MKTEFELEFDSYIRAAYGGVQLTPAQAGEIRMAYYAGVVTMRKVFSQIAHIDDDRAQEIAVTMMENSLMDDLTKFKLTSKQKYNDQSTTN